MWKEDKIQARMFFSRLPRKYNKPLQTHSLDLGADVATINH